MGRARALAVWTKTLEVHLRNTCQGSSVITHVREKGAGEEGKGGKSGDRWRRAIKRGGIWAGTEMVRGGAEALQRGRMRECSPSPSRVG